MKNIKIVYLFIFALLSFASCVKDNSNDEFKELNKITIEGIEDRYEITLGEKLEISPIVKSDDDDLSYLWYVYSTATVGANDDPIKKDTLAHTKNISEIIGGGIITPGVEHKLVFRVTDNKTGVHTYNEEKSLFSVSEYSKGILMLCETGEQTSLNLLLENNTIIEKIYSKNNNGSVLEGDYREVVFANPQKEQPALKQIFLFADNYSGGEVLNPNSMALQYTVREMFDGEINDPIINVRGYSGLVGGNVDYVILNNQLHKRAVNSNKVFFQSDPLVISNLVGESKIQNYAFALTLESVIYDEANGIFAAHAPFNMGALIRVDKESSSTGPFDVDNIGNYSLISSGLAGRSNWMIMNEREKNELTLFKLEYYFDGFNSGTKFICNSLSKSVITSTNAPNLSSADFILPMTDNISNFSIYIKDNRIYSLNVANLNGTTTSSQEALLEELDAKYKVTNMIFETVQVPDPTEDDPNKTKRSTQLRLMVQDNSLTELKGGLIIYEISTVGGLNVKEYSSKIGGFCDKVIDVAEKDS